MTGPRQALSTVATVRSYSPQRGIRSAEQQTNTSSARRAVSRSSASVVTPSRSPASRSDSITPSEKSSGVEAALAVTMRPSASITTQSVNVPPVSIPMMCGMGGYLTGNRSFDHVIGAQPERRRDRQSQAARRFEIQHELERLRLLHGQVPGLGAAQDPVHVHGRSLEPLAGIGAVGQQAAELR